MIWKRKWTGYSGWFVAILLAIALFFTLPAAKEIKKKMFETGENSLRQTLADIPRDAFYFIRQLIQPKSDTHYS